MSDHSCEWFDILSDHYPKVIFVSVSTLYCNLDVIINCLWLLTDMIVLQSCNAIGGFKGSLSTTNAVTFTTESVLQKSMVKFVGPCLCFGR